MGTALREASRRHMVPFQGRPSATVTAGAELITIGPSAVCRCYGGCHLTEQFPTRTGSGEMVNHLIRADLTYARHDGLALHPACSMMQIRGSITAAAPLPAASTTKA